MKYLLILLTVLNIGCIEKSKQTNDGKANWEFINCMNSEKVHKKCKKFISFSNKVGCMSRACGRSGAKWQSADPKTFKGPFDP